MIMTVIRVDEEDMTLFCCFLIMFVFGAWVMSEF